MMFLEGPAIGDGIVAWKRWEMELKAKASTDRVVLAEITRAEAVIKIFEQYPNGVEKYRVYSD